MATAVRVPSASIVVRALPESDSFKYQVSTDSRNGTTMLLLLLLLLEPLPPTAFLDALDFCTSAFKQRPSTVRDLLMSLPSRSTRPAVPALPVRSLPAKSTRQRRDVLRISCGLPLLPPPFVKYLCCMLSSSTEWLRLESALKLVLAVVRRLAPTSITRIASAELATASVVSFVRKKKTLECGRCNQHF